jgi:hypothetical protein
VPLRKITTASAERGVIGNTEFEPPQAKHAAGECLSLAQGKVKHHTQHQHHLDRQIGVDRLSARCVPPWRLPPVKGHLINPECQIATPLQSCLIGRPAADTVTSSRDAVATGGVELERHTSTVSG